MTIGTIGMEQRQQTPFTLVRRFLRGRPGQSGSAMVEFALIVPAFLAIIGGILEISGLIFVQTLLDGGVKEASRQGILGSAPDNTSRERAIRAMIEKNSFGIIDMNEIAFDTLIYDSFGAIGQPEPFEDRNGNGRFDAGEPFSDVNGNGSRDNDQGRNGLGDANDIVLYRVAYDWDVMIPLFEPFFGEQIALEASVAVRNEPFGS